MKPINYSERPQKPSLNSMIDQKERAKAQAFNSWAENDNRIHGGSKTALEKSVEVGDNPSLLEDLSAMALQDHLAELRKRIIICIITVLILSGGAYYFAEEIVEILTASAGKLYYMRPTEAFFTYMKVSFFVGLLGSSPIIIYQIWAFVSPALTGGEKRISHWLVPGAIALFWMGIGFAYFFVLPAAISFFVGFGTADLLPLFSISQYIDFIISFLLPFGIVFELPLVVLLLAHFNFISSVRLKGFRKYFILVAFVIGAAISPTPDVFSQSMIAMPMIILYEISIFMTRILLKK